jgi:putative membrane-bound dehydrogenase-like protein
VKSPSEVTELSTFGDAMKKAVAFGLLLVSLTGVVLGQDKLQRNSGQPYLPPDETVRQFKVADGFEVKVVAAEPDIINPIAMCFDERGRMWVVESFEYPKGAPAGKKPRDRIKILEDTDGDGRADKITLFADGLNLATGIAVGHGGVFVGAAPDLLFLRDTDGDDRADTREVLLTGFGREDTHELLNTFTWGPDGWLYGCHGVFTYSKVRAPDASESDTPVPMNAAVWRYHPRTRRFEIFAEGTSNPWGIDFDGRGNMFLTCCVIPHMFHMIPGGRYIRQAGANFNPYDFGQLNQISDHLHHEESGWAHAGCVVLEGDLWPKSLRGSVIFGSIHGNSIKRDTLAPNGSTFTASHAPDFLQSGDKNFRPVNQMIGPDGAIYVIDWCDQWPCHQTPPDLWDKEHGRIYKIQRKGTEAKAPRDLRALSDAQLVQELKSPNPSVYRTALRLIDERRARSLSAELTRLAFEDPKEAASSNSAAAGAAEQQLRALWALFLVGGFDESAATAALRHGSPAIRCWGARLIGECAASNRGASGRANASGLDVAALLSSLSRDERWRALLEREDDAAFRLQLAATCQRLGKSERLPILKALALRDSDAADAAIPLMLWFALEPTVATDRDRTLEWLHKDAPTHKMIVNDLVPRVMRRLVATNSAENLAACVAFAAAEGDVNVRRAALSGVVAGLEGRRVAAPSNWGEAARDLSRDSDMSVRLAVRRLGANFRDPAAIREAEQAALDAKLSEPERIEAIRCLAVAQLPQSLESLQKLLGAQGADELRREVLRALGGYNSPEIPGLVIEKWETLPESVRADAQTLLTGRKDWAHSLLDAIAKKQLEPGALSAPSAQRIVALKDPKLTEKLEKTWGSVRQQTPGEIDELIKQMRQVVTTGKGDAAAGRDVFEKKCAVCHKFNGQGADVGPDITGADRSVEYLLINILDPNRVVGQPYYTHVVATKGGRVITGKLVSETPTAVTLQGENNKLDVIARENIDDYTVKNVSVMPEGLPKDMSSEQFRDLIEYLRRR